MPYFPQPSIPSYSAVVAAHLHAFCFFFQLEKVTNQIAYHDNDDEQVNYVYNCHYNDGVGGLNGKAKNDKLNGNGQCQYATIFFCLHRKLSWRSLF